MATYFETSEENFKIRFATVDDAPLILQFIKALADWIGGVLIGIQNLLIFTKRWVQSQ